MRPDLIGFFCQIHFLLFQPFNVIFWILEVFITTKIIFSSFKCFVKSSFISREKNTVKKKRGWRRKDVSFRKSTWSLWHFAFFLTCGLRWKNDTQAPGRTINLMKVAKEKVRRTSFYLRKRHAFNIFPNKIASRHLNLITFQPPNYWNEKYNYAYIVTQSCRNLSNTSIFQVM